VNPVVELQDEPQLCQVYGPSCAIYPRDVMCPTTIEASRNLLQASFSSIRPLQPWSSAVTRLLG